MSNQPWYLEVALPALLRHARSTYGRAMRAALARAGYDDIPANGLYVIGGLALGAGGVPIGELVRELGITKQGAGQLVDTLVMRGYLVRTPNADDRRQLIVTLTERGWAAAATQLTARMAIDAELLATAGEADVLATRRTLAALIEIGRQGAATADPPDPRRDWRSKAMGDATVFRKRAMDGAAFRDCAMAGSRFEDVNLARSTFTDVDLHGSTFNNVNLVGVVIEDADITGLTILGHDIQALVTAHEAKAPPIAPDEQY